MADKAPESGATPGPAGTREAILRAARRRVEAGTELSVGEIAVEAGVSRQTVHAHFGGARGLLAALTAEGLAVPDAAEPTRDRLIDAAIRSLARPGGGFASIEAIATEAGLTKGAFYHHFADRGQLLAATAERVSPVADLQACLEATAGAPLRESLIALAGTYYSFVRRHADLIRNLAVNSARDPEYTQVVMGEIIGKGAPLIFAWYADRVGRGELRPVHPSLVIQMILGPAFMLVSMGPAVLAEMVERGIQPGIYNVEAYVDLVLQGVSVESQPAPTAF